MNALKNGSSSVEKTSRVIYWCIKCNVPLLSSRCSICGEDGKYCSSNLKPVFGKELEIFQNLIINTSTKGRKKLPSIVFRSRNRFIANGRTILRFKLVGDQLEILGKPKIPISSYREICNWNTKSTYRDKLLEANEEALKELHLQGVAFIKKTKKRFRTRDIFISFSGGKDSSVTAFLVKKAIGKKPLLFSNTEIEFPETVEFIHEFARNLDLELIETSAPHSFLKMCENLGPPSRMMRWCCSTQKSGPINAFYTKLTRRVLSFDGIRRKESNGRSERQQITKNPKFARQVNAYPIFEWNDLDVWLYLFKNNIPINPLYEWGFARIGCWACPNMGKIDSMLASYHSPDLLQRWKKFLLKYAINNGRTPDWVYGNFWKMRRVTYQRFEVCTENQPCTNNDIFIYNFNEPITEPMINFFKIFGDIKRKTINRTLSFHIIGKRVDIWTIIGGRTLRVRVLSPKNFTRIKFRIDKQIIKALNCARCGACIGSCPNGAIEVDGVFNIDVEKCNHCLQCATNKYIKNSCVALHYKSELKVIQK